MIRFFHSLLIALGLVHIAFGPNNALQVVAWAKMLADYSTDRSFTEAAEMTFDGEHPCPLCLALEDARAKEAKTPAPLPKQETKSNDLFPLATVQLVNRRLHSIANGPTSPARLLRPCRFIPELPTPPPQLA